MTTETRDPRWIAAFVALAGLAMFVVLAAFDQAPSSNAPVVATTPSNTDSRDASLENHQPHRTTPEQTHHTEPRTQPDRAQVTARLVTSSGELIAFTALRTSVRSGFSARPQQHDGQTDATGRITIDVDPTQQPGPEVRFACPGGHWSTATTWRRLTELPRSEQGEVLVIAARRERTLTGVVQDAHGSPVQGLVTCSDSEAPCDAGGRFEMLVPADRWVQVTVTAKGLRTETAEVAPGSSTIHIALVMDGPTREVAGRIVDPADRPIADVLVKAGENSAPCWSGSDGMFRLEVDQSAEHLLCMNDQRPMAVIALSKEAFYRVVMPDGRTLRGVVVATDNTPIGAARVTHVGGSDVRQTATDGSGRFEIHGAGPGQGALSIWAPGHVPHRQSCGPDETEFAVTLRSGMKVVGMVQDDQGRPVSGAFIQAFRSRTLEGASPGLYQGKAVTSDRTGMFVLTASHDPVVVEVSAENHQTGRFVMATETKEPQLAKVSRGAVLRGRVVDATTGAPVRSFHLRLVSPSDVSLPVLTGYPSIWADEGLWLSTEDGTWTLGGSFAAGEAVGIEVSGPGILGLASADCVAGGPPALLETRCP
ncbi:MAG: carboxypeptidase regulatory-like domain-containing protein [Planctomycetes bacterium]|nr:carboxypeptidase regulatory-like domain-containing protein [Planctomycetota bacterium]